MRNFLDEPARRRWSAARGEFEEVAADPGRVLAAPMARGSRVLPDQLDELAPEREVCSSIGSGSMQPGQVFDPE